MVKKLVLVARKPIVIQIFTLVCKKLNLELEVLPEAQIDQKVDILVIDTEFIDDRFNILKSYAKLIGAISKEELPFEMANDFTIPVPFLPSSLQNILEEQVDVLNRRKNSKTYISNVEVEVDEDEDDFFATSSVNDNKEEAVEYLESLADDIADDMKEETDESVVSVASLNNGGVLDSSELSNLADMIDPSKDNENEFVDLEEGSEDEWLDLSSIIDQAIDEVNTVDGIYDKFDTKPVKLLLNNYDLDELKPLLSMLDQDIIDSLADGNTVNLQLKFENNEHE